MPQSARSAALKLGAASVFVLLFAANGAAQGNGVLGVYFDANGSECSGSIGPGAFRTLYVLFSPDGDTRGGIKGAEFRIEISGSGYNLFGPQYLFPEGTQVGDALGDGVITAPRVCQSGLVIPVLRFQVQNVGGGSDVVISIAPKNPPSNGSFPCPLVNLCDTPMFTQVCVRPGKAVLNPSGSIVCGSGASSAEWGRVKELYR